MNETVAAVVALLALAAAGLAAWDMWRRVPFNNRLFYVICIVEVALLALLIGGSVALASTDRDVEGTLFISYLVTLVVLLPAAVLWGISERSRWGNGVVVVALLTVAILMFRLLGIWQASNG